MSLETIQKITLDFTVPRIKNVRCVENDQNSRIINIVITNDGKEYPLNSSTMSAKCKIHKPDHTYIYNEAPINSDGSVTINLTDQAMAIAGNARAELQISDSTGKILSTMPFHIIVEKSVLSNKDIESKNESDVINGMINHLADCENPHKTTKDQVGLGLADNTPDIAKNVNSAKKLTTARKINGTSFDGTADITTNKWGAARNISLSGDVSGETNTDGSTDIAVNVMVKDDSHNHTSNTLPTATSSMKGVTTLTNSVTSTSTTTAATPNSVKTAYDKAVSVENSLTAEINRATAAEMNLDSKKADKTTVATSSTLGLIKSGTDITVDSNGNVNVNDNSHNHTVSNISDLTATAKELNVLDGITAATVELNVLDGITATTTELNYVDGVTGNIQTQLNAKAPVTSPVLTGTPKAPTASAGTNTTQIATTAFVQTAVNNGIADSDAMIIKGTVGIINADGTVTDLPTTYKTGWTYRVMSNGTYAGQICEIGDLVIALADRTGSGNLDSDWCVVQTNIDGAITEVKSGDAYISYNQSGSVVTITHNNVARTNTTSTASPAHGGTFTAVKSVTSDAKGHITTVDTETVTLPVYGTATASANGLMSSTDKSKLNGISSGAEVNQNAFSNITVGTATVSADSKTDTLTLVAGNNVTITPDAANDKITIASKDTVYTHPTYTARSSGLYKVTVDETGHVSAAGAVTKSDITALGIPSSDTNTQYSAGTGISLSGTTFSNSGVRSVSTGTSNGTISVNTNGTAANVAVYGLGSAAYTASSAYAAAGHTHSYLPLSGGTVSGNIGATGRFDLYDTKNSNKLLAIAYCKDHITYLDTTARGAAICTDSILKANGTCGTAIGDGDAIALLNTHTYMHSVYHNVFNILTNINNNPQRGIAIQAFSTHGVLAPYNNNDMDLGASGARWKQIYAASATILTSDRNQKKNEKEFEDDFIIKLVMGLIPKSFQFKDNNSNRTHYGFIAQDVEQLIESLGITSQDMAAFIKTPNTRSKEMEYDEHCAEPEVIPKGEKGYGFQYSLRYEELIAPLYKFCQILYRQNQSQQEEINNLKNQTKDILNRLSALEKH